MQERTFLPELSDAEFHVFQLIAINRDEDHPVVILRKLQRLGYIGMDKTTCVFFVPLAWHIRWCAWCATFTDAEIEQMGREMNGGA